MSCQEIKLSLDTIRASLDQIESFVGKGFFERQKPKYTRKDKKDKESIHKSRKYRHLVSLKPHPLIFLWRKGYANLLEFEQSRKEIKSKYGNLHYTVDVALSKELLELVDIGSNLKEISNISWVNENGSPIKVDSKKFWSQRLKNPMDFEKAIYEIKVASSFKKAKYTVKFIRESKVKKIKTPDLLIEINDKKIYLECKQKDKKTQRDQRNENLWDEILTNTLKIMDKVEKNYAVVVKTNSDLNGDDRDFLIKYLQEQIGSSKNDTYNVSKFEITLRELIKMDTPIFGPFNLNLEEYGISMKEPNISVYQHADVKLSGDMKVEHKNPRLMVFASTLLPDRIEGIIRSVDRAYKQIPKTGPGIIYIDINTGLYNNFEDVNKDLMIIRNRMKGKLNLTRRVNAVILTASSYIEDEGRVFYRVEIQHFINSEPTYPLEKEILNRIFKTKIR